MKPENKEQEVCVNCGICCDNTLFDIVVIQPDEVVKDGFTQKEVFRDGVRYFTLPCPYFDKCCTIYDQEKPRRCTEFKCWLLKRMTAGEVTKAQAQKIVREILEAREKIVAEYAAITGEKKTFLTIYRELAKTEEQLKELPIELKTVHFRSNLLYMQLARWFKAPEEFEKYFHSMS